MKAKDYIIIAVLIGIVVMIVKMMKTSKDQNAVLMAVAIKTGAVDQRVISKASKKKDDKYDDEEYEEEEQEESNDNSNTKGTKKVKLKKTQKQTVGLFEDNIPKQIGELRDLYMSKFSDIDKTKFYNTLYNLKPSNTLNFEKIDGKNYWGLGDWFDEEGSLFEEYADKIAPSTKLTILPTE